MKRGQQRGIETYSLAEGHGWRARPGHKILVLGRGAVRLEIPDTWIVAPDADSVKARDRAAPDDSCSLAVSFHHWPAAGAHLAPATLLQELFTTDPRGLRDLTLVTTEARLDTHIAWSSALFVDPVARLEARGHFCVARRGELQALVTFDCWLRDEALFHPTWRDIIASLQLGEYVQDPLRGPSLN